MKRFQGWSIQKRTGAVKKRIRRDYNNFLNSVDNVSCATSKSSSCNIRQGSVGRNTGDLIKNTYDLSHNQDIMNNFTWFAQERVSSTQQGSVEQNIKETEINTEYHDSIPLSDSEDEEEEINYNEYTKIEILKKKLKTWSIENNITQTALKQLLLILNESYVNTSLSLPKDPRTILQTPKEVRIKNIEGGQYWHHGIIAPLTKLLETWTSTPDVIHLSFNFDGLPIFKSAKKEFWPILANVFEVDSDPFIIGIYYGTGKPKNLEEYLNDYVTEMKSVLDNGIRINEKNVSIKIRCFVCDSPARAFIKGVCNFNGKHGCLKCTTVGDYSHISHTVVFSTKKDSPRTNENFRARNYGSHHKRDSPLLQLPINMVEDFPVADSLHLIDLGIMKRLLVGWRDGNFGTYMSKLCARDLENFNSFLKKIKLPAEIHRAVRSLDCLAYWKASEFRTFLHYLSVIILPDIHRRDIFEHFLNFYCSITICSSQSYFSLLPLAREMLEHFVTQYQYFYGSHYVTSNVHNLLHVVDEVEKFGPLQTFNAYPFENQLYLIKRMLRQGDKPLSQIAKRLCEKNTENPSIRTKTTNNVPYITTCRNISILHFGKYVLSSESKDKYFMTHIGDIFELTDITCGNEKEITIYGQKIMNKEDIFEMPIKSSYLNIYKIKEPYVLTNYITAIKPDEIKCKLVCIAHKNTLYIQPLLHTLCIP